jgi:GntR family transcriptional repressor for pyruvate dehydrogenase complex
VFQPLEPRLSAVDAVARILRRAILHGELKPGTRLPPERALAERFQVNRITVRGALAQLATSRLVTVRQGSGYQVQDYRRTAGPELIAGLLEAARDRAEVPRIVADLLLVRRMLARAALEKLAERPHRSVRKIADALGRFTAVATKAGSTSEIASADMDMLAAILDATGSTVLQLCFNVVQGVVSTLEPLRDAIYREPERNVAGYGFLMAWLEERDPRGIDALVSELERRDDESVERMRDRPRARK